MGRTIERWGLGLVVVTFGLAGSAAARSDEPASTAQASYEQGARPLVQAFCAECHTGEEAEGGIDLARFARLDDLRADTKLWLKVADKLETGEMPPEDAKTLPLPERRRLQAWITSFLKAEALATAGDPGPVLLRRLTNAQYGYTLRDLTGLEGLDLTREFPTDSAAGEGFTSTGGALVMSPSLLDKYLDAAKRLADHAVLLPDGFRFSPGTSRRDWSDEAVDRIRGFYRRFTDDTDGTQVNLQGIVFNTNGGGRLPLERYLAALLEAREALASGAQTVDALASKHGLSPKYLGLLRSALETDQPASAWLDRTRATYRAAKPGQARAIAEQVGPWQQALWRYASVGHIGKVGGPKAWMEPVSPLADRAELRIPFPPTTSGEVRLFLDLTDAGDGPDHDLAVWERPRIVTPGRPDLPLRDVRATVRLLESQRADLLAHAAACLDAAARVMHDSAPVDVPAVARQAGVPPTVLAAWFDYLGVARGPATIPPESLLATPVERGGGYDFVRGWSTGELPNAVANASDQDVRIPGQLRAHGVAMHPSPQLRVAASWRSPVAATVRISGRVQHAHPECGNGVTWRLDLRRGGARQRLAAGTAQGQSPIAFGPFEGLAVQPGDLVSLSIGPRDGNHSCDLTAVDLSIAAPGAAWDLAADVSPDLHAGNPHADRQGHPAVWHFHTEPDQAAGTDTVIPAGSLLARWQASPDAAERLRLAQEIQALLMKTGPPAGDTPDAALHRQLTSLRGPLLDSLRAAATPAEPPPAGAAPEIGPDPSLFGHQPDGTAIDPASLCVQAPSTLEIRLPAELVAGSEFVASGVLATPSGREGSVQFAAALAPPETGPGPRPGLPIVATTGSAAHARLQAGLDAFRELFPPTLCYTRIVPVDEVVTLTLYYREDDLLKRLMLDDRQAAELDRLWDELRFVSHEAISLVDVLQQLLEYASQDADPKVFEPLRGPFEARAAAFREALVAAEPRHLDAVVAFAAQAYRRPLTTGESDALRQLYRSLRAQELPHDEALRLTLARLFVAPAFLYRVETAGPGREPAPLASWELASRLSYFLWSSQPDAALRARAEAGDLTSPDVLASEAHRMLADARSRRLAEEFARQWLHVYDFNTLDEKSERHFPTFAALRSAMDEETVRFFDDFFRNDRSVLSLLDADHTFLNEALAAHYGIPGVTGPEWRRVDGVRQYGRGGILALATTLAKQSGASRTSPILRGNWISEVLLGEKLPRPPKNVPQLPDDESALEGLTVRQVVERHTSDPRCASCHQRIDPFGFALEAYDAIGRRRDRDLGDRPISTQTRLPDGASIDGLDGLRRYLLTDRRDAFVRQFGRKLLGFALGRSVQLSDEPLLDEMQRQLQAHDHRISAAIETIVRSPQFREIRGQSFAVASEP